MVLPFTAGAQNLYTGVRMGTSLWLAKYGVAGGPVNPANNKRFSFDAEFFVRRDFNKGKWAVELNLGYTPFKNSFWKTNNTIFNGYTVLQKNNDIYFYEADITVLRDISSPLPGYFLSYLSHLKSYIGFSLIPTYQRNHEAYQLRDQKGGTLWLDNKDNRFTSYLGISYNHFLPLSKHWVGNSVFAFRLNPFDGYIDDNHEVAYPNMRFSIEFGIAYKW
jgi:hypothetical protein